MDEPVLWQLKVSHYNEKAPWPLDYKGVPHRRRSVDADGSHRKIARELTGGSTFPVLELDGEAIGDSTRIIEALEARQRTHPSIRPIRTIGVARSSSRTSSTRRATAASRRRSRPGV